MAGMISETLTAEEEALKTNTDCVYFLASPLTCKKGAECEYRHSEIARLNPRDCYYWLNGSCLNPKCAFRHPPLEGMLNPQIPAPSGPTFQPSQTTATPVLSASQNSGKQGVPCIFFQQGFCLKGDRCPFSHGPVLANHNKAPQGPGAAAYPEPSSVKKPFVGLEKCSTQPSAVEAYVPPNPTKVPFQAKPPSKPIPGKEESIIERHVRRPSGPDEYPPKYRQTTPPFANGDLISRTKRVQQVYTPDDYETLNGKDPEDFSREPSPGFDVLVDDELKEGDYYQDEDHYERTRGHDDRRLTPVNDYDIRHSVDHKDYDSMVDADRDTYHDPRRYESTRGRYGRDDRRVSSERILEGSERRRYPRGDSPDRIDGSDLRNRLSKHRKVNGLRSVISHDLDRDGGDRSYRGSSRRDTHYLPANERVGSDRLRGRIKLPGRSTSPLNESGLHRERGNSRGRLSPGRVQGFGHQVGGRVQDRIRGRVHEDSLDGGRDFRGPRTGDMLYDNDRFAGPKSLTELKVRKGDEYNKQPVNDYQRSLPLGKRKYLESNHQAENVVSFEGPKPLSEILKRKRGGNGNEEDSKGGFKTSKEPGDDSKARGVQMVKGDDNNEYSKGGAEASKELDSKATDGRSLERNSSEIQMEEGLIVDDEVEEEEHEEAYAEGEGEGEGEGEYEYEQVEGDDYKDEAENAEEGEYAEDDDGDDFAKKIGVMFS